MPALWVRETLTTSIRGDHLDAAHWPSSRRVETLVAPLCHPLKMSA